MEGKGGDDDNNKEQDRYLPIANIGRIMKSALPKDAKIAKEARETVQECVSEFISFITSEACDKCKNDKRKTINGDDLIYSLYQLGFERYLENLNQYFNKYKQAQKNSDKAEISAKNNDIMVNQAQEAVQQRKYNKNGNGAGGDGDGDEDENSEEDDEDEDDDEDNEDMDDEENDGTLDHQMKDEEGSLNPEKKSKGAKKSKTTVIKK